MVLRVEKSAVHSLSPHLQSLPDLRLKPTTFGLQVRLFNPVVPKPFSLAYSLITNIL